MADYKNWKSFILSPPSRKLYVRQNIQALGQTVNKLDLN